MASYAILTSTTSTTNRSERIMYLRKNVWKDNELKLIVEDEVIERLYDL